MNQIERGLDADWHELELRNLKESLQFSTEKSIAIELDPISRVIRASSSAHSPLSDIELNGLLDRLLNEARLHCKTPKPQSLFENRPAEVSYNSHVFERLTAKGDVTPEGKGFYSYSGEFLKYLRGVDRSIALVAEGLSATEVECPVTQEVDVLERSGFFDRYPHQVQFLMSPKTDVKSIESLSVNPSWQRVGHVCRHALCLHPLRKAIQSGATNERMKVWTTTGRVFRNEIECESLKRLREYSMREVISVGPEREVRHFFQFFKETCCQLLVDLKLDGRIATATDSFYSTNRKALQFHQLSKATKLELLLRLNADGEEIAVASINFHGDHFFKVWDAQSSSNALGASSCVGFGLERFVYAVLSQHGLESNLWPAKLQKFLGLKN